MAMVLMILISRSGISTITMKLRNSTVVHSFPGVTLIGGFSYLDLLTNTLGGIIGYYIYKLIYREKNIRGLNIASIIMILLFVPIVVFAAINTLINIEIYIDIILRKI